MDNLRAFHSTRPLEIHKPEQAFYSESAKVSLAKQQLEELLQEEVGKAQDAALTIGIQEFKPGLVEQVGLQQQGLRIRAVSAAAARR